MSEIPNDMIRFAMERAAISFGGDNKDFTAAGFSNACRGLSSCEQTLDGRMVAFILAGRKDVVRLEGGCHYRIVR